MRSAATLSAILAASLCLVYGQNGVFFFGRDSDFYRLPPQRKQGHEYTFVRLIYNGRIPGYFKNWYTDYPKGERQLIDIFKRLTGVDIAPETRRTTDSPPRPVRLSVHLFGRGRSDGAEQ